MQLAELNRFVVVTLQVEGIHRWKDCPIDDVSFLKYPHRHIFHIKATKRVTHNDRDVEIIMLKRDIQNYFNSIGVDFGNRSCEDIAEQLLVSFNLSECEVLEDGENGACLRYIN